MSTFTLVHVTISLVGIFSGLVVVAEMIAGKERNGWTALFLVSTGATSVTGFFFPIHQFTPAIGTGIVSLLVLAVTVFARLGRQLEGGWRRTYAIGAVLALYLNFFVLIVQCFLHVPALKTLAPTQTEPPFAIAQTIALLGFIAVGALAAIRFRPAMARIEP
jgi:hypothetical protein